MEKIITRRTVLTKANMNDLIELEFIEKECIEYFKFDPKCEENHSLTIKECLTKGDIPPGGKKENYFLYCIRENNVLIGFLDYYIEYISKDTVYFNSIYIKKDCRSNKIGQEVVETIFNIFALNSYKNIQLHVSLRNALALKFWVKQGFDEIVNVECNGNLFAENFGGIELIKRIK